MYEYYKAYYIRVSTICFYMGVMYYNIIVVQMVCVMTKQQGEQGKTIIIEEFATGNKCYNI